MNRYSILESIARNTFNIKKAFDKVWHAALWANMRKYNIGSKLVRTIEHLYDNATSAVIFNSSIGDWFRTTVGVRPGCLLSPTLFNIFLERIMTDALENHQGTVSIGGRTITNLRFADDIDGLAGDELELAHLVERLEKTSISYGMEISAENTKLMRCFRKILRISHKDHVTNEAVRNKIKQAIGPYDDLLTTV